MSVDFANLPKSVQEEILYYLNSGDFRAAVSCRDRHLKKMASSCQSRINHPPFSNKANEQREHC